MIIIFNSFFEYGFIRRGATTTSSSGMQGKSSSNEDGGEPMVDWTEQSNPLSRVQQHYWEYMTIQFSEELDSVNYINFYYEDATTFREKALGWILLALSHKGLELKRVILEVFNTIAVLQLYRQEDSYFWQNRRELLDAVETISRKDFYNPCPLLEKYTEYIKKKTVKRSNSRDIIKFLDHPKPNLPQLIKIEATPP